MRSDATHFALTAPATLTEALTLLAQKTHTPIAGGTELMVAFNTGRLTQTSLLSIQHLHELRFIRVEPETIHIGAATTFTDIRNHPAIAQHLPLLIQSASWTGSIANQNRATLGGNLCNASPAADTPPALLCYNATLTLISSTGQRQVSYADFHLGYKRTALAPNELLHTVSIPIPPPNTRHYLRKVGTRNAQAISKIALAAVVLVEDQKIQTLRLAAASLADRPPPPPRHRIRPPQPLPRPHRSRRHPPRRPLHPRQRSPPHRRHPLYRPLPLHRGRQPPRRTPPPPHHLAPP